MGARARLAAVTAVGLLVVSALPVLAAPPANDDIDTPIVVTTIPYTNTQDTSEATTGATDPYCWGQGPTVWYAYTAAEDGRLEANTFGSDYDTTLLAAVDDGEGGLDVIACNDDASSLQSRVRFDAREGETYLFMVGAYDDGPGGELVFNLLEAPPGQALSLMLSVDPQGTFHRDGSATIRGTVTCTGADWAEVYAEMSQQVGRFQVIGWGWDFIECSPDGSPFEIPIQGITGSFAGGPADVYVDAYTCGEDDCAFDFVETTVRLRR
jgi:hypothetical protein